MRIFALVLTAAVFLSLTPAQAQPPMIMQPPPEPKGTISVTGEAQIRVVPDEILISMTVQNRHAELAKAQADNQKNVDRILRTLTKQMGIKPEHVQTDFLNVQPNYFSCDYRDRREGRCDPLAVEFFDVRRGLQIRLKDTGKYENLITQAIAAGATHIDNIQFITTELRKHRDKARELAAEAAREKAAAIAGTLDMQLGRPRTIHVDSTNWHYWGGFGRYGGHSQNMMSQNVMQAAPSSAPADPDGGMALGQIKITARVSTVFEIEEKSD